MTNLFFMFFKHKYNYKHIAVKWNSHTEEIKSKCKSTDISRSDVDEKLLDPDSSFYNKQKHERFDCEYISIYGNVHLNSDAEEVEASWDEFSEIEEIQTSCNAVLPEELSSVFGTDVRSPTPVVSEEIASQNARPNASEEFSSVEEFSCAETAVRFDPNEIKQTDAIGIEENY